MIFALSIGHIPIFKSLPNLFFFNSWEALWNRQAEGTRHTAPPALLLCPPAPTSAAHEAAHALPLLQALAQEEEAGGRQVPHRAVRQPQGQQHPLLLLVHVGHLRNYRLPLNKVVPGGGHKLVTHDLKERMSRK